MTTINYTLLDGVFDFLDANPDRHRQDHWIDSADVDNLCGSRGCFAGHTALASGWLPVRDIGIYRSGDGVIHSGPHLTNRVVNPETQEEKSMAQVAMSELGLNEDQASALFGASNTRLDLSNMIQALHDDAEDNLYPKTRIYRAWTDIHGKLEANYIHGL